jgi:transposase-like protein
MNRKRYSVEQVVAAVKQNELGTPVPDIVRKLGVAEQTIYRWKQKYGGPEPGQARELVVQTTIVLGAGPLQARPITYAFGAAVSRPRAVA